jgi:hypothetical protein
MQCVPDAMPGDVEMLGPFGLCHIAVFFNLTV